MEVVNNGKNELIRYSDFILRRVHSLLGIVPIGLFLFEHTLVNSFALMGQEAYNRNVDLLRSLPFLLLIEFAFIIGPIALHAVLGIIISLKMQLNVQRYGYLRNWLYLFQRITGILVLIFITYHVITLRFLHDPAEIDFFSHIQALFRNGWMLAFYSVGLLSAIYHFCNGISTFCIVWGITVGPVAQNAVAVVCVLIGIALCVLGFGAVYGFLATPLT